MSDINCFSCVPFSGVTTDESGAYSWGIVKPYQGYYTVCRVLGDRPSNPLDFINLAETRTGVWWYERSRSIRVESNPRPDFNFSIPAIEYAEDSWRLYYRADNFDTWLDVRYSVLSVEEDRTIGQIDINLVGDASVVVDTEAVMTLFIPFVSVDLRIGVVREPFAIPDMVIGESFIIQPPRE